MKRVIKKFKQKDIKKQLNISLRAGMIWVNENIDDIRNMERMEFREKIFNRFNLMSPEDEFVIENYLFEDFLF